MQSRRRSSAHAKPAAAIVAAVASIAVLAAALPASAATGAPAIKRLHCLSSCPSGGGVSPGSRLQVRGERLARVTTVVFHGRDGSGDDASVGVESKSATSLEVTVPKEARTGPVSVWVGAGAHSPPTRPLLVKPREQTPSSPPAAQNPPPAETKEPSKEPASTGPPRIKTSTSAKRFFFGAATVMRFSFTIRHSQPATVRIVLIRLSDRRVVQSWAPRRAIKPNVTRSVTWAGASGRGTHAEGRYAFRITARGQGGTRASNRAANRRSPDAFSFFSHIFPIRGRHNYGSSGSRFGAGRSGHSHQGQDVFARCGTKLVAARGGVVKWNRYHSAAGYYLIIDGAGTGVDYAYMHLARPSPLRAGRRVYTGQRIGSVGQSGNAQGCHLHFEMWGRPGWYDGGRPFDPLPSLRSWDRHS